MSPWFAPTCPGRCRLPCASHRRRTLLDAVNLNNYSWNTSPLTNCLHRDTSAELMTHDCAMSVVYDPRFVYSPVLSGSAAFAFISISTTLGKEIRQAITKGYPKVTPRTIFTTNKAFSGRAKDVLPMLSKSNVVYEFTCCCGQTYIGKTIQCLTERAKRHLPSKLFTEEPDPNINKSDSAITKHVKQNVSCLTESLRTKFKVVHSARCQSHLDVLEALYIRAKQPILCQ